MTCSQASRQLLVIGGNRSPHRSSNCLERLQRRVGVDGGVDRPEVAGDLLAFAAGDVAEAVPDQVDDAGLHPRLGEHRFDRFGEPLEPVDAGDQDVLDAALLEVVQDLEPELRALALLEPHPEHVPVAFEGDAQREVAGPALHAARFSDLDHEAVEEHDRVEVIERPLLPGTHVLHDRVGDAADQVAADLDAVELAEVRLDVPDRHPARVQRDDPVVEPREPRCALRQDLRLEAALPVPRRLDPHRPVISPQRLRRSSRCGRFPPRQAAPGRVRTRGDRSARRPSPAPPAA